MALFVSTALIAMDRPQDVFRLTGRGWALDLVFNLDYVGHKAICSFAATSKASDEYMLSTAEKRRNLLKAKHPSWSEDVAVLWHKYGSAAYSADIPQEYEHKRLEFGHPQLSSKRGGLGNLTKITLIDNPLFLSHAPLPFRNKGKTYFHLVQRDKKSFYCATTGRVKHDVCDTVWRYEYDGPSRCCYVSLNNNNRRCMSALLNYPVLLKAVLNSTVVAKRKKRINSYTRDIFLNYSLEGVTLPDDYKQYDVFDEITAIIGNPASLRQGDPWEYLDPILRLAIEKLYNEQQESKGLQQNE